MLVSQLLGLCGFTAPFVAFIMSHFSRETNDGADKVGFWTFFTGLCLNVLSCLLHVSNVEWKL